MLENLYEDVFQYCERYRKVSKAAIQRKFKLTFEGATKLAMHVYRRRRLEARELSKTIIERM